MSKNNSSKINKNLKVLIKKINKIKIKIILNKVLKKIKMIKKILMQKMIVL